MEFKSFDKISRFSPLKMVITQKIHGSNASIIVFEKDGELDLKCGSRNRWIFPEDDNFGFATFVHEHKQEFIEKLGLGTHHMEWAGPGINSGEGLTTRTACLFDVGRYNLDNLPPNTVLVPLLYEGPYSTDAIDGVMADLKQNGSKLVPGFMRSEGIVIQVNGKRYKKVFTPEETAWKNAPSNKGKNPRPQVDYSHLLQPIRLEKLLSRDERLLVNFPKTLPDITKEYMTDLLDEGEISGDEDQIKAIRKGCSGQVYTFIKEFIYTKVLN